MQKASFLVKIKTMADQKVDVHAHFLPPFYRDALLNHGYAQPDGMPGIPSWSPEAHLTYMDANGIAKSILSISSPGVGLTNDLELTTSLCRKVNDYAAALKRLHPTRFGFFASLPLPDVLASVAEVRRVRAGLDSDGFVVLSNAQGIYLGDPVLRPVLQELNSGGGAVVFIHPTAPCRHGSVDASLPQPARYEASSPLATAYRAPMFEFFFDSARSILDLLLSGTMMRFPALRWVISHCGGVLPSLLDRMFLFSELGMELTTAERDPMEVSKEAILQVLNERSWFDLAGNPVPNLVYGLRKFVGLERLVFGSDVPWTRFDLSRNLVVQLERYLPECVGKEALEGIYKSNAEALLG